MTRINDHYLKLPSSYLFSEVGERVKAYKVAHPEAHIISLGIGDVTQPLSAAVIRAIHEAAEEMAQVDTFRGYGPYVGYEFLTERIARCDYAARGVHIESNEIFVSDGAKSDTGNIQEIFAADCSVALTDPAYPVYVDSHVMAGRTGAADAAGRYDRLVYLPCTEKNSFRAPLPDRRVDLVYLCYPNNPTGAAITREMLVTWVDWARKNDATILYDAAYEAYIRDPDIPHSIFEIDGAREVAIEFRSFSKTAGFTGTRCAFTVVPKEVTGVAAAGRRLSLNSLWLRRQSTKFGGVPYLVQRAAAAVYTDEGQKEVRGLVDFYMENARIICEGLETIGLTVYGGRNAPYVWVKAPAGLGSWAFFDKLLAEAQVVSTPGVGFGPSGEGYLRLAAFGRRDQTEEAVERIKRSVGR